MLGLPDFDSYCKHCIVEIWFGIANQWIFMELDMCINIIRIWFGIAYLQISSISDRVISPCSSIFSFPDDDQ